MIIFVSDEYPFLSVIDCGARSLAVSSRTEKVSGLILIVWVHPTSATAKAIGDSQAIRKNLSMRELPSCICVCVFHISKTNPMRSNVGNQRRTTRGAHQK